MNIWTNKVKSHWFFLDHTKNTYLLWNYFKQGLMIPCVTHVLLELKVLVYYVTFWTATSSLLPPSPAFSSHEMVGVWARHDAWGVTLAQRQPAVEWRRWPRLGPTRRGPSRWAASPAAGTAGWALGFSSSCSRRIAARSSLWGLRQPTGEASC
jgi:hypothetical protein